MNQYLDYIMEQLEKLMALTVHLVSQKSDRLPVRGVRTSWL